MCFMACRTRVSTIGKQPDPFVLLRLVTTARRPLSAEAPWVVAVGSASAGGLSRPVAPSRCRLGAWRFERAPGAGLFIRRSGSSRPATASSRKPANALRYSMVHNQFRHVDRDLHAIDDACSPTRRAPAPAPPTSSCSARWDLRTSWVPNLRWKTIHKDAGRPDDHPHGRRAPARTRRPHDERAPRTDFGAPVSLADLHRSSASTASRLPSRTSTVAPLLIDTYIRE